MLSVHDSRLADDWIYHNYEHECLVKLRVHNIRGPFAWMLSTDVPALTIFGAITPLVHGTADELAQSSGFPVIIRPLAEDPSAYFK
jgi:hypothetical protein